MGAGWSPFDVSLIMDGCQVFMEVQPSGYWGNGKDVQLTEVFVPIDTPMLFAKITAWPRTIEIWDLEPENYASQQTFLF